MEYMTEKVFETLEESANSAGWDCDINNDNGSVRFIREMPFGEDYEFVVLFDTNDTEELINQITLAIDDEAINVTSSEFVAGLEMPENDANRYANKLTSAMHNLAAYVNTNLELLDLDEDLEEELDGGVLDDIVGDIEEGYGYDDYDNEHDMNHDDER